MRPALAFLALLLLQQPAAQPPAHRINRTIELLAGNRTVFGLLAGDHSVAAAQTVADSELDFTFADMEHNPLDFESLQLYFFGMLKREEALKKGFVQPNVTPMVRLPGNGGEHLEFLIKQALDLGAMGLMIPMSETREDAMAVVRASRYAQAKGANDFEPAGFRGAFPNKGARYWGISPGEYVQKADLWPLDPQGEILLTLQIETQKAVDNIDGILSVPGIGVAFIGPGDMSLSIGLGGEEGRRALEANIQKVLDACRRHNVVPGIFAGPSDGAAPGASDVERRVKQGFRLIAFNDDGVGVTAATTLRLGRGAAGR
jgi:4-hydroxy-2-oxoheptanedioate aldolase